jgi:hypothetical protein
MYINISWKYAILVRNSLKKKFIENIILGGGVAHTCNSLLCNRQRWFEASLVKNVSKNLTQ